MSFPPNLGITNSFIIDSTSSIFHEFPSLLPHLDNICSPFSKHRMNGYSRIKKSNTNRSKSVDFAELSLTRTALTPSKFSAVKIATVHEPIPEHEADDGAGEVFGAILGRKSCVSDRNSEAEKGAAALQEEAAAKRSISIKRSASVSDGYSRIHHRCAEDDDGEESGSEFISHAKGVKKKKGKFFRAFKRLFGL